MKQLPLIELTQQWTPEQLLAVYDLCRLISETLWQQHEDTLLEQMIERDQGNGHEPYSRQKNSNLDVPFDEPIPF